MSESTKKTIFDLLKIGIGFAIFVAIAFFVPDGSVLKVIFAYGCAVALGLLILYYTPLGNPIKALIRKFQKK